MERTKRTPVKIKSNRKPVKLSSKKVSRENQSVFDEVFPGMATPQQTAKENVEFGQLNVANISPVQLSALQRENFALWAATAGIEVDHKPFDFKRHKYLLPMYSDMSKEICLMKAAQMGATIWMLLRLLHFTLHNAAKACLYFPTQDGVSKLSKDRLRPLIDSNPTLETAITDTDTIGYKQIGAKSSLYLQHMGGEATKDSTPFDMICFDEVRLLNPADIDQARERISHSEYKYVMQVSTAGFPGNDIHRVFMRGTQNYWHVNCNCWTPDEKIIVRKKGSAKPEAVSFFDLAVMGIFGVQQYQALSWNSRRSKWQYRDITKLHDNGIQKVKKLILKNGAEAIGTGDHRMFVPDGSGKGPSYLGERVLGSLLSGDQLTAIEAIPDVGEAKSRTGSKVVPEHVPWDQETLYVTGAFVAEGSWKDWNKKQWVNIAQIEGKEIRHRVSQWAKDNLIPIKARKSGLDLGIGCRPDLVQWFAACGRGCENKKFPRELLNAPVAQLQIAVDGYLDGDAHRPRAKGAEVWAASTTSKVLTDQFRWIGLRLGIPLSIKPLKVKKGRKPSWSIRYNTNSLHTETGPRIGLVSTKVSHIENVGSDQVFDIAVEGNHNYVLANSGLLVHNCRDGFVPSDHWPDCVCPSDKGVYLQCPICKKRIEDTQDGQFVPHNPKADFPSYHISQFLSKYITLAEIWDNWQRTQNLKEFYNAKLGKPYVDEENQPVKDEDLMACENPDLRWGKSLSKAGGKIQRAMGVDQMGGNNYAVITERHADKKRVIHYEIIEDRNPLYMEVDQKVSCFKRLYQLMKEFDIDLCLIDAMPNINEALEFARAFPKRVFVTWYVEGSGGGAQGRDMVQWGDRAKEKVTVKRGGPKIKFKWTAILNRYMSIDFALSEIANRNVEWPVPETLIQVCRGIESGLFEPLHIFRTHFYMHMKSMVRQKTIIDEETGRFKMEWYQLGVDPHSVHAWNLCNIALERLRRQPIWTTM